MPKTLLVSLLLLAGQNQPGKDAAKTTRDFEGIWQLVSAMTDGKPTPADVVSKIHVVIKDGKHSVYFKEGVLAHQIPFKVDTTRTPYETTDALPDGKLIKGITKLDADTLTSCVAKPGKERPTEFSSKPGSGHTLRVFKRAKS
jgi:uncharacterized protein (TIGR03067 family)